MSVAEKSVPIELAEGDSGSCGGSDDLVGEDGSGGGASLKKDTTPGGCSLLVAVSI